ncbi:MAG: tetratricopeptide repeat protein, partial [Bacteroidetes bacterium]|nr:tetratricopeptide repeat protein [Bacteroidota bacterium]
MFVIGHSYICHAQSKTDSLLSLLKKDKEDTSKINHLNALARELSGANPDTSIFLSTQALSLSEKLDWKKGIANSYLSLSWCKFVKGDYPKSLDYNFNALRVGEEIENKKIISSALGSIGNVYWYESDLVKAFDYHMKSLKIAEELGDKYLIGRQLSNIGIIYDEQASSVAKHPDSAVYRDRLFNKAIDYYFRALKIAEELGNKSEVGRHLGNIGSSYAEQGKYEKSKVKSDSLYNKALDYYFRALKIDEELGDKNGNGFWLSGISEIYTAQKKHKEAEEYLLKALNIFKEVGGENKERQTEELLTELYEKTNRYQLALEHYKKAMALKDTLFSQENKKQLVRKEMNYEFEKKETKAKAEQDKKDAVTAEASRREKVIRYSVMGGLALMFIIAAIIFRSLRITRKQKNIIEL